MQEGGGGGGAANVPSPLDGPRLDDAPRREWVADGEPHAYVLDLGSVPGWDGTITRLRLDPVESAGRDVAIDRVWFVE